MKITEKQFLVLLDTLRGTLTIADRIDNPLFGYSREVRVSLYNELINQQNQEVNFIKEYSDDGR
jgi:hypothetical protein